MLRNKEFNAMLSDNCSDNELSVVKIYTRARFQPFSLAAVHVLRLEKSALYGECHEFITVAVRNIDYTPSFIEIKINVYTKNCTQKNRLHKKPIAWYYLW